MTSVLLSLVIALIGIIGAALWYVLGRVNSRIDRVDTRLDGFDDRLWEIDQQGVRTDEKLVRLDESLQRVQASLAGLDGVVQHFNERLDLLVRSSEGIEKRLGG